MGKKISLSQEIYTHEHLWRSATKLLETAEEKEEGAYYYLLPSLLMRAVSMTKCKKRSRMRPEIECVRGEQLCGTPEAPRLAWPSVQCPGNPIQLLLGETAHVAALGQVLPP